MGQRGGVSQEPAQAAESAGPLLPRPFCLLWYPPLPRGESVGLSPLEEADLAYLDLGSVVLNSAMIIEL